MSWQDKEPDHHQPVIAVLSGMPLSAADGWLVPLDVVFSWTSSSQPVVGNTSLNKTVCMLMPRQVEMTNMLNKNVLNRRQRRPHWNSSFQDKRHAQHFAKRLTYWSRSVVTSAWWMDIVWWLFVFLYMRCTTTHVFLFHTPLFNRFYAKFIVLDSHIRRLYSFYTLSHRMALIE